MGHPIIQNLCMLSAMCPFNPASRSWAQPSLKHHSPAHL